MTREREADWNGRRAARAELPSTPVDFEVVPAVPRPGVHVDDQVDCILQGQLAVI
jgi:hypothetical protein